MGPGAPGTSTSGRGSAALPKAGSAGAKLGLAIELPRSNSVLTTQALVFTGLGVWALLQSGG